MTILTLPLDVPKPRAEYALCQSQYGQCLVAATESGICWLSIINDDSQAALYEFASFWGRENIVENQKSIDKISEKIFSNATDLDVVLCGSDLQIAVWRALCNIERGQTSSYSDIATKIGRPKAVRAVASAIGQNNISYIVPCHRVVRIDGALGGYRWGLDVKRAMLKAEQM